jgi:hypothetical protein
MKIHTNYQLLYHNKTSWLNKKDKIKLHRPIKEAKKIPKVQYLANIYIQEP